MDLLFQQGLVELAADHGFDVTVRYASAADLVAGVRQIEDLPLGSSLADLQCRALLQNLAQVIRGTCASGQKGAIRVQANLYRFRFLRATMPLAADAYAVVLGEVGVDVPDYISGRR